MHRSHWRPVLGLAVIVVLLITADRAYRQRRLEAGAAVFGHMTDARMEALLLDEARERATIDFERVLLWATPLAILALYSVWELTTDYSAPSPSSTDASGRGGSS